MPRLTKHSKKRIIERIGASDDAAKRNAKKAFKSGIRHNETFDELKNWLDGKFLGSPSKPGNMRIYNGYLYIFANDTLITVYPLPEEIEVLIPSCTEPNAYNRYISRQLEDKARKKKKNKKEYQEKLYSFRRLVLLNDIRSYADGRYPVEISGIGMANKLIRVYYVPTEDKVPDLRELAGYIREHTHYSRVQFIRKKEREI